MARIFLVCLGIFHPATLLGQNEPIDSSAGVDRLARLIVRLADAVSDPQQDVRDQAARALKKIGRERVSAGKRCQARMALPLVA